MEAALGMPEAIISAGCPDRIRETLPNRTLLTLLRTVFCDYQAVVTPFDGVFGIDQLPLRVEG